jgi:hydrogenase expression/formation protein HypE
LSTTSTGKLPPGALERVVLGRLGAPRPEVLLGPRAGADSGIVKVGAGRVLAITTDPLSLVPALGPAASARLSCRLVASDLWTSGIPPQLASVTLALPPDLDDGTLEAFLQAMHEEWTRLEVAVVAGHTGRYDGCGLTIVGAATVIGVGDEGRWVGPPFVRPGDALLLTKGCAIEATAIAARLFPRALEARLKETMDEAAAAKAFERARAALDEVSVIADCRAALRVGVRDRGVSALHDATEGGVLGGLVELARAANVDLRVERGRIPLRPEARAACAVFGIDPYWTLSEGSLIVAARPDRAADVLAALEDEGLEAARIGEVVPGSGRMWLTEPDGSVAAIDEAPPDPYWPAYARAVREGWS